MEKSEKENQSENNTKRLFPLVVEELKWAEFSAEGFKGKAAGIIFDTAHPTCCGVALGGLGTGCLDIETSGVLGFSTLFPAVKRQTIKEHSPYYRNPQYLLPFLGISQGGRTWVLATQKFIDGGEIQGCTSPLLFLDSGQKDNEAWKKEEWKKTWSINVPKIEGVEAAKEIHYWGHYPVADLEYEIDAPVSVGLRSWAPFIPGDLSASNVPGAVFEVHIRNKSVNVQKGTLAFSFPGPRDTDKGYKEFLRSEVDEVFNEKLKGITVSSAEGEIGYTIGIIGVDNVQCGGALSASPTAWSHIAEGLTVPKAKKVTGQMVYSDPGASLSTEYELQPEESTVIRIVLAWYAPKWTGGGYKEITFNFEALRSPGPWESKIPGRENEEGVEYTTMYSGRFEKALDVAEYLTNNHNSLLKRILAWQEAVYSSEELPVWLRDCLINNLNLITDTSFWAQPRKHLGDWSFPDGAFGLSESPRGCDITGCIVSNWYGDFPILYFFPELESMILRNYKEYIRPDGAIPFLYPHGDLTKPTYEWLLPLNGPCFVDLVGRLWMRTGNDDILREFYSAVKKNTIFTMNLKPAPEGIISVPWKGKGQEWWEHTPVYGMVPHLAGMRLSNLSIAGRMAERMGDEDFANKCRKWYEQGSKLLEEKLWAGDTYMFYRDPETGKESDDIMSSQLDGDFANYLHGLKGVFRDDRAKKALETIEKACLLSCGVAGFASHAGNAQLGAYGTFTAEIIIVGMTYMYHGMYEMGMDIIHRNMDNLVRQQRHAWDLPNLIRCDTNERIFGTDYFQMMILWAVPAAMKGNDVTAPCKPGGLIDRIIKAGQPVSSSVYKDEEIPV